MPLFVKCPSCKASLRVPTKVVDSGREIHCPRCKAPVSAFQGIEYNPTGTAPARPVTRLDASERTTLPPADNPFRDLTAEPTRKPREGKLVDPRRAEPRAAPEPPEVRRAAPTPPPIEEVEVVEVDFVPEEAPAVETPKSRRSVADDYDEEDDGREMPRRARDEELEKARTGLNLVYIATCLFMGAMAALLAGFLVAGIIAVSGAPRAAPLVAGIFGMLGGLTMIGGGVVALVGMVFCCYSPERQGARTFAVVAVGCAGGTALLSLLSPIVTLARPGAASLVLSILTGLLSLAAGFLFLFYQRAMALAVKAKWVALNIRNYLIAQAVAAVVVPLVNFLILLIGGTAIVSGAVASPEGISASGLVMLLLILVISLGAGTVLFVWYERNLLELIDTIDSRLKRRSHYGTPAWVALLGANAVLFLLLVVLVLIQRMVGPSAPPSKQNEPDRPATAPGEVPLFRPPIQLARL